MAPVLNLDPKLLERVNAAIADVRAGRMVILVDDEDRENEGDLCVAAEFVTAEAINFMVTHGRGLICLTLEPERQPLRFEELPARPELPFAGIPGRFRRGEREQLLEEDDLRLRG